jgi:hypothetical protein
METGSKMRHAATLPPAPCVQIAGGSLGLVLHGAKRRPQGRETLLNVDASPSRRGRPRNRENVYRIGLSSKPRGKLMAHKADVSRCL